MLDDDAVLLLPLITELQGSNLENKSIYKMKSLWLLRINWFDALVYI